MEPISNKRKALNLKSPSRRTNFPEFSCWRRNEVANTQLELQLEKNHKEFLREILANSSHGCFMLQEESPCYVCNASWSNHGAHASSLKSFKFEESGSIRTLEHLQKEGTQLLELTMSPELADSPQLHTFLDRITELVQVDGEKHSIVFCPVRHVVCKGGKLNLFQFTSCSRYIHDEQNMLECNSQCVDCGEGGKKLLEEVLDLLVSQLENDADVLHEVRGDGEELEGIFLKSAGQTRKRLEDTFRQLKICFFFVIIGGFASNRKLRQPCTRDSTRTVKTRLL
uniref:Uncharacterized protein n=1 Tax=Caenorhabditis japonica TaxID=281687 RepID=A0A8R1I7Q4_CAEJA